MNKNYKPGLVAHVVVGIMCLFSLGVAAQQDSGYPGSLNLYERTWLATDRDVYIPGDKIIVSLATIDGFYQLPVTYSAVAYVELYNASGAPIVQDKALLREGQGSLVLHVPKNVETDYYYLRAYTNYQKNFGENSFYVKKIRMINPFKIISIEPATGSDTVARRDIAYTYAFSNDSLVITCKDTITAGALVVQTAFDNDYVQKHLSRPNDSTLVVALHGMKNVLSVSATSTCPSNQVCDSARGISVTARAEGDSIQYHGSDAHNNQSFYFVSAFRADQGIFTDTYCTPPGVVSAPSVFVYRPELSSDLLFGKVALKNGVAIPKHILVTIPRSLAGMMVVSPRPDSTFVVDMGSVQANTGLLFTPTDTSGSISVLFDDEFFPSITPVSSSPYIPEAYLGTYIQSLMVNVQLADAFSMPDKPASLDPLPFYGYSDENLDFSKYINLPSIEEYIHELLPSVYVVRKRKRKSIRISDYNNRGFIGKKPLVLVDGTPFFNHAAVLYVPPVEVASIYVLNRSLTYMSAQFDGVFDMRTRSHYSEELARATNVQTIEYVAPKIFSDHTPLFSNTPAWQSLAVSPPAGRFTRVQAGAVVVRMQGLSGGKPFDVYSPHIK